MGLKCVIFDLDGVLVDTSVFHGKAWADLVRGEGYEPPEDLEDRVKGISRMESLKIALGENASHYSEEELTALADRKNACYLEAVKTVKASDLYPGARALLDGLRAAGIKVALGSASKNARAVLDGLGITGDFDVISDGTTHARGKPHPDVFLGAAWMAGVTPAECIVVEDAPAGITAALHGGFIAVGLGPEDFLDQAHVVVDSLEKLGVDTLQALHAGYRIPTLEGPSALPAIELVPTQDYDLTGNGLPAAWESLPWTLLQQTGGESGPVPSTRMKMRYSESALYVLIEGEAQTIQGPIGAGDPAFLTEDHISLLVMPDPWQRIYLDYKLSPLGHDVTLCVANHMGESAAYQRWSSQEELCVQKRIRVHGGSATSGATVSGWTMEIKIPFTMLAPIAVMPPKAGTVWYGNVYRVDTEQGNRACLSWSAGPGEGRCHDYAKFGKLQFGS